MFPLPATWIVSQADLVIENAAIWTSGSLSNSNFIAVTGDRFVYVGKRDSRYIGPKTRRVDAHGKIVLPGFIDSHTHLGDGGLQLTQLDLRGANTKADFLKRIQSWADKVPEHDTIIGNGWSAESWPEKSQPTRQDLDAVTGEHPAMFYRMDGHSVVLNSIALARMNITKASKSPPGGSIDKDPATGEPTGLLRETAMASAAFLSPPSTPKLRAEALNAAAQMANRFGVTAVSEICTVFSFGEYANYASLEKPTLRFALYPRANNWTFEIEKIREFKPVKGWVQVNGLKAYMDGSLGSRTAWMLEPYTKPLPDQKSITGLPRPGFLDGTYARGIREAAKAGLQVIVHAIGDRANREILNLFEKSAPNLSVLRFRVEHAQHLTETDIRRFGKLGVIASMQPYHKADDGRYCEDVIGTKRSETSYAFKSLLNTGGRVAFGSDWPVVSANPWLGIESAVTGKTLNGKRWMTQQSISVHQALSAYTTGGAFAMKREKELGQIKPGFFADFQILNASPFGPNVNWSLLHPEQLYVAGRRTL